MSLLMKEFGKLQPTAGKLKMTFRFFKSCRDKEEYIADMVCGLKSLKYLSGPSQKNISRKSL